MKRLVAYFETSECEIWEDQQLNTVGEKNQNTLNHEPQLQVERSLLEEVNEAIKNLKNYKALGKDDIPSKLLKHSGKETRQDL